MAADAAKGQPTPAELEQALRLFDETTRALDARARRLEEVLTVKQRELEAANRRLNEELGRVDRLGAWLNLLLSAVGSGVVAMDTRHCISTCNPAAEQALGGLQVDLIGSDYRELFPDSPIERITSGAEQRLSWTHQVPGLDGRPRILQGHLSAIRDSDGALFGAVEVFEDVTEVRRLREEAERGERLRALGEMAAGVAHEIRNPLNGIEGFASLLQRDLAADDPRRRYAGAIGDGVRHLNRAVTGLLEFTRPKMPQRRPVPMAELLSSCVQLLEAEQNDEPEPVRFELQDDWGAERLSCDGTQIRQVLLNLLQNAAQAAVAQSGAAARVCIRATAEDGGWLCTVDDNGTGVPPEARKRIFTPFFTTKEEGTGLGLAVAHALVNLHGGSLGVDDAPGDDGGARFRLYLPAT